MPQVCAACYQQMPSCNPWLPPDYHLDSLPQFPLQPVLPLLRSTRDDPKACNERTRRGVNHRQQSEESCLLASIGEAGRPVSVGQTDAGRLSAPLWEVDFSSALYNRTGKYFIGRDLIEDQRSLIAHVRYGRLARLNPPNGWQAKAIAWLTALDQWGVQHRWLTGFRPVRPLLHLDPYTVLNTRIATDDAVLVHDLGPITHPMLFSPAVCDLYRRAYAVIARSDPRLIFVSMASARAYSAIYGNPRDGRVIYPPLRKGLGPSPSAILPAGVDRSFLLTVGSLGRRKNQKASIEAFAQSGLAADGVAYVLCGTREPGAEEVVALARKTPGIVLLDYVSDSELTALYRDAAGFVLVSNLEGFGIPVAEAIAANLIPLVSANSVLEEVAGDGALTASPDDIGAIARGMRKLIAMAPDEKVHRRALLAGSIARFTRQRFASEWRSLLFGQCQDEA